VEKSPKFPRILENEAIKSRHKKVKSLKKIVEIRESAKTIHKNDDINLSNVAILSIFHSPPSCNWVGFVVSLSRQTNNKKTHKHLCGNEDCSIIECINILISIGSQCGKSLEKWKISK
jgi:hypothetical protein